MFPFRSLPMFKHLWSEDPYKSLYFLKDQQHGKAEVESEDGDGVGFMG